VAWDDEAEKLLADRPAAVGVACFSAALRRKRFFRKSNMQDYSPAVNRQAAE
jgi:hypothetical protein